MRYVLALVALLIVAVPDFAEGAPPGPSAVRVGTPEWERCRLEVDTCKEKLRDQRLEAGALEGDLRVQVKAAENARDATLERLKAAEEKIESLESSPTTRQVQRRNELEDRRLALLEQQMAAREDAASAAACATSQVCSDYAQCGFDRSVGCAPTRDAHCRSSKQCLYLGLCALKLGGGGCIGVKDADCKRSLGCRLKGLCTLLETTGECY